jgi:hemerythrin-like domain-containing protein
MSDSQSKAIGTIRSEHRSLAAVIYNMRELQSLTSLGKQPLDCRLFWSMVHYIDAFPDEQHHPMEDNWLFARLKLRTREADALIS